MTHSGGYQPHTTNGPRVRADVVDVYVFTRGRSADPREQARGPKPYESEPAWPSRSQAPGAGGVHFLQLLRSGPPLDKTWHPVMGHVEPGESAVDTAIREMREELALAPTDADCLGVYALEQVHPFFIAAIDSIVMSPRFAVEVAPSWSPALNAEHSHFRWVREDAIDEHFMWPGQKSACREILREIVADTSLSREHLRVRAKK
jgi:8-oxo-dGTP pyrophosphatase MutT (NUDIX family)